MKTTARFLAVITVVTLWAGIAQAQATDPVLSYMQANAEKNVTPIILQTAMELTKMLPNNHPKKAQYLEFFPRYHIEQFGRPMYSAQPNVLRDLSDTISDIRSGLRSPSTIADPAPVLRCRPWGSHGEMRCTTT